MEKYIKAENTKKLIERLADSNTRWDVDEIDPLTFHMKISFIQDHYYGNLWAKLKINTEDELYALIEDAEPSLLAALTECIALANRNYEEAWAEFCHDGVHQDLEDSAVDRVWHKHYRPEFEAIRRVETVVYGVKYSRNMIG